MDLPTLRSTVDSYVSGIPACQDDLIALYNYVGLPTGNGLSRKAVGDVLSERIKSAFASGHGVVRQQCGQWLDELIQDHVIDGAPFDPYYAILCQLRDSVGHNRQPAEDVCGSWIDAIHNACDGIALNNWTPPAETRERIHVRTFYAAKAAKLLKNAGWPISRQGNRMFLEEEPESRLVGILESLIITMGGLNVARRIYQTIAPLYDEIQERFHVVPHPQPTGAGQPQVPFGYLLLLAVKHLSGAKPYQNTEANWQSLCNLATIYAAFLDVQPYAHTFVFTMDPRFLLRHLQELAFYDTLFRLPQARGRDIIKIAQRLLKSYDGRATYGNGWTIDAVLTVSKAILEFAPAQRGPIAIDTRIIKKSCPQIDPDMVDTVIADVLSYPQSVANQYFSKPSDAPSGNPSVEKKGHDFFMRPLLVHDNKSVFLLDRSYCAPNFLEALLSPLRQAHSKFDDRLGAEIEAFLREEFHAHAIPTLTGKYRAVDGEGQCDLVIETDDVIILFEIKKKPLTRRARAGSDAHIFIDLAQSLLDAQLQAGWHEVRLRRDGFLDLQHEGVTTRLTWNGRQIERIAVSLLDFGSFQDRMLLTQFFQSTINAEFSPVDTSLKKTFARINNALKELREQVAQLQNPSNQLPFFNCWFLSVPQLLVALDGVDGPTAFKKALWRTRAVVTGTKDFYHDFAWWQRIQAEASVGNS